ncbi:hypothetical protein CL616_03905 [archaeon]|nr:hypothetical protein [archaeon]
MGLFGPKKKEEKDELPPLEFPELPKTVPAYEKPVSQPEPIAPVAAREIPISARPMPAPIHHAPSHGIPGTIAGAEQPLFIKIDKYRDVVKNLGKLKSKLSEAGNILNKLNRLKEEEDRELAAWHNDLEKIRGQLMEIDKRLFE